VYPQRSHFLLMVHKIEVVVIGSCCWNILAAGLIDQARPSSLRFALGLHKAADEIYALT
jgi:hypothetical protein